MPTIAPSIIVAGLDNLQYKLVLLTKYSSPRHPMRVIVVIGCVQADRLWSSSSCDCIPDDSVKKSWDRWGIPYSDH